MNTKKSKQIQNNDNTLKTTSRDMHTLSISYRVVHCYLGYILIAFTENGLYIVEIGSDPNELSDSFVSRHKNARISRLDNDSHELIQGVIEKISHPQSDIRLPLDMQGSKFQKLVWNKLMEIPSGTTVSYSQLAQMIARPRAVRAVANACAKNKLAVLIPCHRVVKKDGSPGGYRWGLSKKKLLLDSERCR